MSIFDTFLNYRVFVDTLPLLLTGLMTTLTLGFTSIVHRLRRRPAAGPAAALWARPGRCLAVAYIDVLPLDPHPGAAVRRLLRAALRRHPAVPRSPRRPRAISMVSAAYSAEIVRAGIEAIPKGQFEAARALGLHFCH